MSIVVFFQDFFGHRFWKDFWSFLSKKQKKGKRKKVCFVLVFTIDRKGRHVEKKACGFAKARQKKHEFSSKIWPKSTRKTQKTELGTAIDQKTALGADFYRKKSIFGRFGGPWGSPWGGLVKDFGQENFEPKKKVKNGGKKRRERFGRWLRVACGESLFDPKRACQH